jgi:hypothetical protein
MVCYGLGVSVMHTKWKEPQVEVRVAGRIQNSQKAPKGLGLYLTPWEGMEKPCIPDLILWSSNPH